MACGTWDDPFDSELKAYLLSHALVRDQPEKENRGILITDKTFLDQFQGQYMIQLDLLEYATGKVALRVELEALNKERGFG